MAQSSRTDGIQTPQGTTKVFNTFELLEHILLHVLHIERNLETLPSWQRSLEMIKDHAERIRCIYSLQRVSASFRNVIASSKSLRVKLFKDFQDEQCAPYVNPLADNLHWSLQKGAKGASLASRFKLERNDDSEMIIDGVATALVNERLIPISKSASWRQMFIASKPTPCMFRLIVVFGKQRVDYYYNLSDRVTLEELADLVVSAAEQAERKGWAGDSKMTRRLRVQPKSAGSSLRGVHSSLRNGVN